MHSDCQQGGGGGEEEERIQGMVQHLTQPKQDSADEDDTAVILLWKRTGNAF